MTDSLGGPCHAVFTMKKHEAKKNTIATLTNVAMTLFGTKFCGAASSCHWQNAAVAVDIAMQILAFIREYSLKR